MVPVDTLTHEVRPTTQVDGLEVALFATEEEAAPAFAAVAPQEFVHVFGLNRPLKPGEPPCRLRRHFPPLSRLCPSDSRLCPPVSQVFPDSICYNRWQIHPSVSASARRCGLPSLVDVRQKTEVEQQAAACAAESGKEQHT